jgi:hypothetical protein
MPRCKVCGGEHTRHAIRYLQCTSLRTPSAPVPPAADAPSAVNRFNCHCGAVNLKKPTYYALHHGRCSQSRLFEESLEIEDTDGGMPDIDDQHSVFDLEAQMLDPDNSNETHGPSTR